MVFGGPLNISHSVLIVLSKFGGFPSKTFHRQPFMPHNNLFQRAKGFKFEGKVDITSFQKPTHFQTQH
jgi:hypothetical protein